MRKILLPFLLLAIIALPVLAGTIVGPARGGGVAVAITGSGISATTNGSGTLVTITGSASSSSIAAGTNIVTVTNGSLVTVNVANTNVPGIAAGTNIVTVTNGNRITISVANTNLPSVIAGANITITTNGLGYTVAASLTSIAAGTNIVTVTNGSLVTVHVANTNLPVAIAGTNVTIITNGLGYTISVTGLTNIIYSLARIGPGTNNYFAKFNVGGTNVVNSPMSSTTSNNVDFFLAPDGSSITNSGTNRFYGEYTDASNNEWVELVTPKGHNNEVAHLRTRINGQTAQRAPFVLNDAWSFEPGSDALSGHAAFYINPLTDNVGRIGSSSSRVLGITVGTGNIVLYNSSSQPSLQIGSAGNGGVDGDANSISFWRPTTGITAAFDRFNNLFIFDVAGNTIGFGASMSNCISFIGHSALTGIIQVGTNSSVAAPLSVGLMGGQGSGTDKGGSDLRIIGGPSTGAGTNGDVRLQTAEKALATGSSLNSAFKDRLRIVADPIILTTNVATIVLNFTIPTALKGAGGLVLAHTEIEDGVNMATLDETFVVSANRKGSTVVAGTPSTPLTSPSTSGGSASIANTWTLVANAQSCDLKLTCVTSGILSTNSTVRIDFFPNSSAVPVITHP